jgi:hypothetical protein
LPSCDSAKAIAVATVWLGALTAGTPPFAAQPATELVDAMVAETTWNLPPA